MLQVCSRVLNKSKSGSLLQKWSSSHRFVDRSVAEPPHRYHDVRYMSSATDKFGVGGHKWSQIEPALYQDIVHTALVKGITLLEAGQEGGDQALQAAYQHAVLHNSELKDTPITVLTRMGYRSVMPKNVDGNADQKISDLFLPQDIHLEEHLVHPNSKALEEPDKATKVQIVHNISKDYVHQFMRENPWVHSGFTNVRVVPMLHNPEAQAHTLQNAPFEERQYRIQQRLAESFLALEEQVADEKISSYGIVSNGLCLPKEHPLHLSKDTILNAATQTKEEMSGDKLHLSIIQLPVNLLETTGVKLAQEIKQEAPFLEVHAIRPLTCYPERGTGTGNPFILADYRLPASMDDKEWVWSNEMEGPPEVYEAALKNAMAHFDAEEILQAKQQGQELTAEQRETLDGCKLLQSLLHDVDLGLEKVRSFSAHKQELYEKIIPLIHDTFEGYDEETAGALQNFFAAYGMAVRYAIASNTRKLLMEGEEKEGVPTYPDLPPEMRLQEYGLRFLLKEPAIDKIIIGWSQPDQIEEVLDVAERALSEAKAQKKKENEEV